MFTFTELPISPYLQNRLRASEFVTPTEVQAAAIPHAAVGKDIVATAQTGTGKTLAFLVPVMDKLLRQPATTLGALVLAPRASSLFRSASNIRTCAAKNCLRQRCWSRELQSALTAATFFSTSERSDLAKLERILNLKFSRGRVDADLVCEERVKPVDVSSYVPVPARLGSRMVCLPGEVLQRYAF